MHDRVRLFQRIDRLFLYGEQKTDRGAAGVDEVLAGAARELERQIAAMQALPEDPALAAREPSDLPGIRALRPDGPRRLWQSLKPDYPDRLAGALYGRIAGNILGVPVEGLPIRVMEDLAREFGDPFPLVDYWSGVQRPFDLQGSVSPREAYTRHKMRGVPVDDDLAYTLLGLLILEACGPGFTTADVGQIWLERLPHAFTAEEMALRNLRQGIPAEEAGTVDNPFTEWIGADIRSDPWGYVAPGWPERAAEMAWNDAFLSHRRQGIYGEMLFSAAIAAAFTVNEPLEAIAIGLTEIPAECQLAQHVRWALDEAPRICTFRQAREAVDQRFPGMSGAHTINNACLTVFGLAIGGRDLTRVIGETVAMGLDNDCTAATAGSIVGAIIGQANIPAHWTRPFDNRIATYLNGIPEMALDDVLERFAVQAERLFA